nr:ParB/RepB/Spo0J family partition protein [Streptomyces sp. DSM 41633]
MAGAQNDELDVAERRRRKQQEREAAAGAANSGSEVAIAELAHNPRNARSALEEIEGLADTYASVGVLQSLAVIPAATFRTAFPEHSQDLGLARYVVIGGNRRLAAARLAGLEQLPILINTRAQSRQDILVAAATENLSREELKPLEELATIEELKEVLGTYDAVAQQLGKSPGWVSQRRRLHNLQPEVREALVNRTEGMTIELARDLGKIKDRDLQLKNWADARQLAAARAADPDAPKKPKSEPSKRKVPGQGAPGAMALDAEAKRRREACAMAVAAVSGDLAQACIIGLQSPAAPDEAVALASQWLAEAGIDAAALQLPAPAADRKAEGDELTSASLALALAHCELHMTRTKGNDTSHAHAYIGWLETYADYTPADSPAPSAAA